MADSASSGVRESSPLPITGIFTASFHRGNPLPTSIAAVTLFACANACSDKAFNPQSSAILASGTQTILSSSQPIAEFHGERNLLFGAHSFKKWLRSPGRSLSSPDPPLHLTMRFTGQPRFEIDQIKVGIFHNLGPIQPACMDHLQKHQRAAEMGNARLRKATSAIAFALGFTGTEETDKADVKSVISRPPANLVGSGF